MDWEGLHIHIKNGGLIIKHNADQATWCFGVEIRGKINNKPINHIRCCIKFPIRKDVLDNQKVWWAVVMPKLELQDCDWEKALSGEEALRWIRKHEKKKTSKN